VCLEIIHRLFKEGRKMGNYFDREERQYRETEPYGRRGERGRFRGQRYGGAYENDRSWEADRENPSSYGTGWAEDYDRGYGSRSFTGDEQAGGYFGRHDIGRSYRPSFERDFGDEASSLRGSTRLPYRSSNLSGRYRGSSGREYGRDYEGTSRPPDYGQDYERPRDRAYRGEGLASDRDWFDRATDEVQSWFGDEDAERRRRMDKMRDRNFRGRGPKAYRRSDERIREDINDRLTDHAYLDASDIEVSVKEGEVILTGKVFDRTDKRLAEDVAESISGVKHVQNNLRTDKSWETDTTARPMVSAKSA
jgi:osmotically-inducible protein OsmY